MVGRIIQKPTLRKIWYGNKSIVKGVRHLFWSVIRFFLSGWLWRAAVRLVPMPEPYKNVGVAFAFISLGLFFWGLWGLRLALRDSGLRGILHILGGCFLLIFTFNLLTFPEPVPVQHRFLPSLTKSMQQVWNQIYSAGIMLAKAPEDFRFAFTGSNAGDYLSGFPTPDPKDQLIVVEALPVQQNLSLNLKPGGYVRVTIPDDYLECHSGPSMSFPVSVKFREEDRLLILDGPMKDVQESSLWWKLHGSQGEGWCNENYLLPTQ